MIDLHLNHGNSHEGVYLRLPATPGEVGEAFSMLEELGEGKVTIFDVSCPIQNIYRYIMHTDINDKDNLAKLQKLAQDIDGMDRNERKIFSGALDAESINGLDDVLSVADHLDDYVLLPNINSDTELGRFLVDSGYKNFSEEVKPYLNYRAIGAEYYADNDGAYGPNGYVRHKTAREQASVSRDALITLCMATPSIYNFPLSLPATEEEMEQFKYRLGVDSFAQAKIIKVEYSKPYLADLIPKDCICVEDANELALSIEEMLQADDESLSKFLAVLAVEQPDTFPAALRLAMEQDDYALMPDDPWEYGEQVLRRVCTDQEVLDTIDGFMDYKALGEFQMKEDGVRETEFGSIRRLSEPFPTQEQGQQML